ncbi:hypothetical protein PGT21_023719 [Puccinia graminis f. sp. tritici]|uniref:Uncharacterized protein n=1 Tax=Puccinia graminis f. sp. tritici TaxID=56615 RepID=A0A5B0PC32_PUCGR|nr:hypothetical protein PGT21_023719 [Puccinia graminis f. sp. tritici]
MLKLADQALTRGQHGRSLVPELKSLIRFRVLSSDRRHLTNRARKGAVRMAHKVIQASPLLRVIFISVAESAWERVSSSQGLLSGW